jgi:uncharacterized protein (TIGR02145 family)
MNQKIFRFIALIIVLHITTAGGCKKDDAPPPPANGTVTDVEGNVYKTVKIGNQIWMAENLNTTKYRNGDAIPFVSNTAAWANLQTTRTAAYCNSEDNPANATIHGRLYNLHAVKDSRGLAPVGWHIPSDPEWQILIDFLGGDALAGGKLKESGFTHWKSPNTGADNSSGFTALAGGGRGYTGVYLTGNNIGTYINFWSSTLTGGVNPGARFRRLDYDRAAVLNSSALENSGWSVRCVKD